MNTEESIILLTSELSEMDKSVEVVLELSPKGSVSVALELSRLNRIIEARLATLSSYVALSLDAYA